MIVWTDIESTGLNPKTDHLLEVAVVVTDDDLNEVAATSVVVQPAGVVDIDKLEMDPKVRKMHTDNGLFEEVKRTPLHRYEGEQILVEAIKVAFKNVPPVAIDKCAQCGQEKDKHKQEGFKTATEYYYRCTADGYSGVEFVAKLVPAVSQTPLAGSTIGFDRAFLKEHMKQFEATFSYRSIDVSSVVELAKRWAPAIYEARPKSEKGAVHRALADVRESINYLRYFRESGFVKSGIKVDPLVSLPSIVVGAEGKCPKCGGCGSVSVPGELHDVTCSRCGGA